jgi:hypothetical protein
MTPDSSQIMLTIQAGGPFKNAAYRFNPTTGKLVRVPYPVQVERLPWSLVMQQHLR